MSAILYIDTTDSTNAIVGLDKNGKKYKLSGSRKINSQSILSLIDKIITESEITFSDISAIKVNKGPGSFTGIRVGLAIANTLAYLLKISVNDKGIGEYETAVYNDNVW